MLSFGSLARLRSPTVRSQDFHRTCCYQQGDARSAAGGGATAALYACHHNAHRPRANRRRRLHRYLRTAIPLAFNRRHAAASKITESVMGPIVPLIALSRFISPSSSPPQPLRAAPSLLRYSLMSLTQRRTSSMAWSACSRSVTLSPKNGRTYSFGIYSSAARSGSTASSGNTPFTWASLLLTNGIGPPGMLLYILLCLGSGRGLPTLGYAVREQVEPYAECSRNRAWASRERQLFVHSLKIPQTQVVLTLSTIKHCALSREEQLRELGPRLCGP